MKILVIEDEQKTVTYLRKGLSENGFAVDLATDGEDGLHLAATGQYELILHAGVRSAFLNIALPRTDRARARLRCFTCEREAWLNGGGRMSRRACNDPPVRRLMREDLHDSGYNLVTE